MKVNVSSFRRSIDLAFDALQVHWSACVGENERILWFSMAFRRFNELSTLECARAKAEDHGRFEQVMDRFAVHCDAHRSLWLKARAYDSLCLSGVDHTDALAQLRAREMDHLYIVSG